MAEAVFKKFIQKSDILASQYTACSAGISAFDGSPASTDAVKVLKSKWNIDIRGHRSQSLNAQLVENAFLIFSMTRNQKEIILSNFPQAAEKIFIFKEYTGTGNIDIKSADIDIYDPFGKGYEVYEQCADEIQRNIDILICKFNKENGM